MKNQITCIESDRIRRTLSPWSSITNFVGGEVLNDEHPPHTYTEWCDDDEVVRLIDTLDASGCSHMEVSE